MRRPANLIAGHGAASLAVLAVFVALAFTSCANYMLWRVEMKERRHSLEEWERLEALSFDPF